MRNTLLDLKLDNGISINGLSLESYQKLTYSVKTLEESDHFCMNYASVEGNINSAVYNYFSDRMNQREYSSDDFVIDFEDDPAIAIKKLGLEEFSLGEVKQIIKRMKMNEITPQELYARHMADKTVVLFRHVLIK